MIAWLKWLLRRLRIGKCFDAFERIDKAIEAEAVA